MTNFTVGDNWYYREATNYFHTSASEIIYLFDKPTEIYFFLSLIRTQYSVHTAWSFYIIHRSSIKNYN